MSLNDAEGPDFGENPADFDQEIVQNENIGKSDLKMSDADLEGLKEVGRACT